MKNIDTIEVKLDFDKVNEIMLEIEHAHRKLSSLNRHELEYFDKCFYKFLENHGYKKS